jgi:hypothetical protein
MTGGEQKEAQEGKNDRCACRNGVAAHGMMMAARLTATRNVYRHLGVVSEWVRIHGHVIPH